MDLDGGVCAMKWDFPLVTHFRLFWRVLGRFPEIVYPGNPQRCSHGLFVTNVCGSTRWCPTRARQAPEGRALGLSGSGAVERIECNV